MAQPSAKPDPGTAPHLTRREEFEAALQDYKVSEAGRKILRETPLMVLVAPTSTGRNTLINELLKTGDYYFIVSDTTRPPRQNNGVWEKNGREYFFRSEDEMFEDIKAGMFLEAEVVHKQQVSGISIREIEKARQKGKVAITDVEILGGIAVANLKPDAWVIYLVPPSFDEWLNRINGRTPLTKGELRNRLEGAIKGFELALSSNCFTFIVNHDKSETVKIIAEITRTGTHHKADELEVRGLVRTLWEQTQEFLDQL